MWPLTFWVSIGGRRHKLASNIDEPNRLQDISGELLCEIPVEFLGWTARDGLDGRARSGKEPVLRVTVLPTCLTRQPHVEAIEIS